MELLIEFILDIVVEGVWIGSTDKQVPKALRILFTVFILIVFVFLMILFCCLVYVAESLWGKLTIGVIGVGIFAIFVAKIVTAIKK